jgi:hypothetical protein
LFAAAKAQRTTHNRLENSMRLLSIEHGKTQCWSGFAIHGPTVVALGLMLFQALASLASQTWGVVLFAVTRQRAPPNSALALRGLP